ncbi:helix-turn-helix domain-containing protein [Metabacillus fastidiosus]|uniref:helix-turn-helix domain-containing protein n=1 Tax=Metabacillus fastidiosus TaxID=1458 RepID=UPI003D2764A5
MDLGSCIREMREEKGLSGRELARRSNISQAYLSQLERGENKKPSPEIIKKIAKGLDVDYNELMTLAGYLYEPHLIQLETEKIQRDLENTKSELKKAQGTYEKSMKDLYKLLTLNFDVYYKNKLLTKEEKQKLLTIIETVLD